MRTRPSGGLEQIHGMSVNNSWRSARIVAKIVRLVAAHRLFVIACALTGALLGYVVAQRRPPSYTAVATLEFRDPGLGVGRRAAFSYTGFTDPIASQAHLLRSASLLSAVVDSGGYRLAVVSGHLPFGLVGPAVLPSGASGDTLRLIFDESSYELRTPAGAARARYGEPAMVGGASLLLRAAPPGGAPVTVVVRTRESVIRDLRPRLGAQIREGSGLLDVSFTAGNPVVARDALNAIVRTFVAHSDSAAVDLARRQLAFVEGELRHADSVVASAEVELGTLRAAASASSSRERARVQQVALQKVQLQRDELQAEVDVLTSLLDESTRRSSEAGRNAALSLRGAVSAPVVTSLVQRLIQLESRRDSLANFGISRRSSEYSALSMRIRETDESLVHALQSYRRGLAALIRGLDESRAGMMRDLATYSANSARESVLVVRLDAALRSATRLREEVQQLGIAKVVGRGPVSILEAAALPQPGERYLGRAALGGLLAGFAFSCVFLILRARFDDTLRTRAGASHVTASPCLAVLPCMNGERQAAIVSLVRNLTDYSGAEADEQLDSDSRLSALNVLRHPHSAGAESVRALRTSLLFAADRSTLRRLVVTSSVPGEGKTTTAANLAVTCAQQGQRVLLVDADMRRPRLHVIFGLRQRPGLSELVIGERSLSRVLQPTEVPGLMVLCAGRQPPNPGELAGSKAMEQVLRRLGSDFDLVIIDTPPLAAAAEGAILTARSDGALLLVRAGRTPRSVVTQSVSQLRRVGGEIVGVVLNDIDRRIVLGGGYYGEYMSSYGDEASDDLGGVASVVAS